MNQLILSSLLLIGNKHTKEIILLVSHKSLLEVHSENTGDVGTSVTGRQQTRHKFR